MATTTIQPLPYPGPLDPPAGPAQIKALAEAIEGRTVMRFATAAARDAAIPSGARVAGMMCFIEADNGVYVWSGSAWGVVWQDTGWVNITLAAGFTALSPVRVRRIGQVVHWRGRIGGPWTTSYQIVVPPANLPAGVLIGGLGWALNTGSPTFSAIAVMDSGGFKVACNSPSSGVHLDGIMYPVS